jgi:hypothetical protein
MYLGNIVTDEKLNIEYYNICNDIDNIDETLPTLIIGWKKTKSIIGEGNVSILHKKINEKLYWTFDSKERKSDMDLDLETFINVCVNKYGDNIPYVYLDILYGKRKINFKIIKKILSLKQTFTYITENDMLYIYGENIIFGIDLEMVEYVSNKKNKILNKINEFKNNVFVNNQIFNIGKDLLDKINNKKRLTPYLYSDVHRE